MAEQQPYRADVQAPTSGGFPLRYQETTPHSGEWTAPAPSKKGGKKNEPQSTELPFWDEANGDTSWDTLALEGQVLPGVWRIEGECEYEYDKKKTTGKDGANVRDKGYQPADITLHGEITTRAQWRDMQEVLRTLHPRKKGGPKNPISADHPALTVMGIQMVYIKGIKPPEVENGKLQLRITAIEYIKPVPKKKDDGPKTYKWDVSPGNWTYRENYLGLGTAPDQPYLDALKEDEARRLSDPNYKPSASLRSRMPQEAADKRSTFFNNQSDVDKIKRQQDAAAAEQSSRGFLKAEKPSLWQQVFGG